MQPGPMDNMGKPISHDNREHANNLLRDQMGMEDSPKRYECVQRVAGLLEKDRPHAAMKMAEEYIDTTGAYMLFAALLVQLVKPEKHLYKIQNKTNDTTFEKSFETSGDCRH